MPIWGVAIIAVAWGLVLLGFVAAFRSPAEVNLETDGGVLVVRLGRWDRLLSLRREIRVPLAQIRAVRVAGRAEVPRRGLRLPGSNLSGVLTAGSYGVGANRAFWDVRRAQQLLLILCRPGAEYATLVLEVPDPDAAARRLNHTLAQA